MTQNCYRVGVNERKIVAREPIAASHATKHNAESPPALQPMPQAPRGGKAQMRCLPCRQTYLGQIAATTRAIPARKVAGRATITRGQPVSAGLPMPSTRCRAAVETVLPSGNFNNSLHMPKAEHESGRA